MATFLHHTNTRGTDYVEKQQDEDSEASSNAKAEDREADTCAATPAAPAGLPNGNRAGGLRDDGKYEIS